MAGEIPLCTAEELRALQLDRLRHTLHRVYKVFYSWLVKYPFDSSAGNEIVKHVIVHKDI